MHKQILTLEDLVKFCETQKFYNFNAAETGYQICVGIPVDFDKAETSDSLLFCDVTVFHTGENRNHSAVTEDAAKKCLSSIAYKPVLANFAEFEDGVDFTSHDMEIDEDGNVVYLERQVGCFTADKVTMDEEPDDKGRKYVYARVAIPREYTVAADIIERKNGTKASVELGVNEMKYDADKHLLYLEDIEVMGVTLLGKNPETGEDVQEGMEGARLDIVDFSVENNSVATHYDNLIESLDRLSEQLSNFNIAPQGDDNQRKEETAVDFETNEVIEVEATEEEVVMETSEEVEVTDETPEVVEEMAEETEETEEAEKVIETEDADAEVEEPEEVVTEEEDQKEVYTLTYGEKSLEFAVSMSEILSAMSELVNNTYSESDNDWYMVDVYEADKSVVMVGCWTGKAYKQSYKVRNNIYSLTGDRTPVKACYLTEDEEKELDKMRSNYSLIEDKLAKYETEPAKLEVLASDDYANIQNTEAFTELKKQENHFDLTVDEVREKADAMLLDYAKHNTVSFAEKSSGKKVLPKMDKKKSGRYGSLFRK